MAQRPPNIILILIDDMGWRDIGCYGSGFYDTPNLDTLAEEGMRFTDAYASCPVCSPTRASILTGKYPARLGLTNFLCGSARGRLLEAPYIDHLSQQHRCIAKSLRAGGYQTWHVGKWHLGPEPFWPTEHGFDVNVGGCSWGMPKHGYFSPYRCPTLSDGPDGQYLTDRLTDEAIALIRKAGDKPFFLNLCHYAVHTPIQAKADDVGHFADKARRLGLDRVQPLEEGEAFPCEHKKHLRVIRRRIQSDPAYAAMVWNLDWNIGRLLSAVSDTGLSDNTIVIFTSDNGGLATAEGSPTSNAPLAEGKGWMYEGGTREPLLIKWPGRVAPGSVCHEAVTSTDFYPTLLEMAGLPLEPENHVDGVSMVPLLCGAKSLDRQAIFWHYPHYGNQGGTPGSSVRCGDWKLIEFFEDGRLELYDLRNDIGESHNLAAVEPTRVKQLHDILADWRRKCQAAIPQPNPQYTPWPGRWDAPTV